MKIIFAQGNPGSRYDKTRHNVGFLVLDALHKASGGSGWKKSSKGHAETSEATINGEKTLLVKPSSYYNDTGLVARNFVDFYKIDPAKDFLVVHDDLALPVGTIRTRKKGSDAGNNGIKSLNRHLGQDYARIRIGILSDKRDLMGDSNFVLSRFSRDEKKIIKKLIDEKILQLVEDFTDGSLEETSHKL